MVSIIRVLVWWLDKYISMEFKRYEELSPLAIELLYSFEKVKLPYYEEINRKFEIIKILNKKLK